jgi:hypothetical protein
MQLFNHQKDIIQEDPKKVGLFIGTGGGKTRIALSLAQGKTLVVCPKAQRDDKNWQREVEKMGVYIDLKVVSKEDFKKQDPGPCDTLILDEGHSMLGVTPNKKYVNREPVPKTSQIFEAIYKYIRKYEPERIYIATATIVKSPMTVWGAGVLLGKYSMGSHTKFRDIFYVKLPMGGRREVFSPRKDQDAKDRLAKNVHSLGYCGRLEDYFDVPEQTYKTDHIELTKEQIQSIKDIKLEYPDPLVQIGKRHQIENGVLTDTQSYIKDNKIEKIKDYAVEFPRMIIFARYTMQIEKIKESLKGHNVYTLTGQTKNTGDLLNQLRGKEEYILIVQSSISAGWELPECPVMIFASRDYSLVNYLQAQGRILRANHLKKNLYINLTVKGGIDEAIDKALESKCDFDERLYIINK